MKDKIKSLFKGYYVQFRKKTSTAIISVGYINAPDNYMQYSDSKLVEIEKICCNNDLHYTVDYETESGYRYCSVHIFLDWSEVLV